MTGSRVPSSSCGFPTDRPWCCTDSAAWIWLVAADGEPDVAAAVAELVGRPAAEMADEVNDFLDDLVGRGLIEAVRRRRDVGLTCGHGDGLATRPGWGHNCETRTEAVSPGAIFGEDFNYQ